MFNTVLAVVKNGKIEMLEPVELPEGKKVLVTLLSDSDDEDTFWRQASQEALDQVWDNSEDNVYAQLLDQ